MESQSSQWIVGQSSHGHEYLLWEVPPYVKCVYLMYIENQICETKSHIRIANSQSQVEFP